MDIPSILHIVACIALIFFGVYSILQPLASAKLAHLTPDDNTGRAEIRISFGGLSLAMGAAPMLLNDPIGYRVVGIIWLAVFIVRLIATYLDRPKLAQTYLISGVFELVVGIMLFV